MAVELRTAPNSVIEFPFDGAKIPRFHDFMAWANQRVFNTNTSDPQIAEYRQVNEQLIRINDMLVEQMRGKIELSPSPADNIDRPFTITLSASDTTIELDRESTDTFLRIMFEGTEKLIVDDTLRQGGKVKLEVPTVNRAVPTKVPWYNK
jgi:hypothetical protein